MEDMSVIELARSIGGIIIIMAFVTISMGDVFLDGVSFNPWLVVVMLGLIYGLLSLEHFVLDHFPLKIRVSTPTTDDTDDNDNA
jgi:hypothetical protein